MLNALVSYKTGKINCKRATVQFIIWVIILAGIVSVKFIYEYLFSNHLTQTEPLSLFDVIEITGIILILFIANRTRIKLENLERTVYDIHQELSIRTSLEKKK